MNPAGYGFVQRAESQDAVFVPPPRLHGALDGDEVDVELWPSARGFEGRIVAVVERQRTRLVGVLEQPARARLSFRPEDPRIVHECEVVDGAPAGMFGQLVVARIVDYPQKSRDPVRVAVERSLGDPGRLDAQVARILAEAGIDEEFPDDVIDEAAAVPADVVPADLRGRADLRALPFMTIDPRDARDFDDAVCVQREGETEDVRVHVAVADVSHYVREGTALEIEAEHRCFSTYLPDRAIPMLPPALSTHICSLVPGQDRLAMVVGMTVDPRGAVHRTEVMAAVIHSRRRLTYEEAAEVLEGRARLPREVVDRVLDLRKVADRLRTARLARGAVELELPETKVLLDEDDRERVRDIVRARASEAISRAYNLIEELMVAANEAVGRMAVAHKLPLPFRVHDPPGARRLEQLSVAAEALGTPVDPGPLVQPRAMQKFVTRTRKSPRRGALHMLALRSMAQAEYRPQNVGHYALASKAYVHFTSPIRRYPDLVAHRVLKAHLGRRGGRAGPPPVPRSPDPETLAGASVRSSARERAVQQAERETKALYAVVHLRDRIGDRFEGTVTGISATGVFVTLDRPFVDGMVRIARIDESWRDSMRPDESGVRLVGARTNKTITLGDRVVVEVEEASVARRRIDLLLVQVLS
jgi:ribonuclease R